MAARGRGGAGRGMGEPAGFGDFFGGAAPRPFLRRSGPEGSLWARDPAGRVDAPLVNAPLLAWAARAPLGRGGFGAARSGGIVEGGSRGLLAGGRPGKRPPSSYFIFLAEARETILRERPSLKGSAAGVAREAAARWKALSAEERAEYTQRAAEGRAAHKAREEAFRATVRATKRRAADAELEGLEAVAATGKRSRALPPKKRQKKVAKKAPARKQAPGPATPERAPKGKAQAPKKTAKVGRVAGQKQKQKQKQKNKPAPKPAARRSSRRGSAK